MSELFIWDEKYDVGDEVINNQHKQLLEIGNEIQDADFAEAGKYIMKLFKYTKDHFKFEEDHMKSIDYPELAQHKIIHDDLITKLSEISSNFINNGKDFEKFKLFVHDWLTNHLLLEDKKYFDFSKAD